MHYEQLYAKNDRMRLYGYYCYGVYVEFLRNTEKPSVSFGS